MSFRLVPKSVTLNDLERRSDCYFVISAKSVAFGAHCVKVVKIFPDFLRQKCSAKLLVFSDISLVMIRGRELLYRGTKRKMGSQT